MSDHGFDADDETRRLLGTADPARSLPPVDADALASILEDTMSQPVTEPRTRSRLPLYGGAAAAALVAAVAIGVASSGGDDDSTRNPGSATDETVTQLNAGPAVEAKCAVPTAEYVAAQELAFEGTVTSIADGVVSLDPIRFYRGEPTDVVTVAEPDMGMSEMPVEFEVGETYLVGANGGYVSICGLAGLATDELRALYDEAFGD